MVDLTKAYHKALDEEEGMTKEQLAIKNVGKQVRKVKEYLNHYCNVRMYSTDRYPCPLWVCVGGCGWVCACVRACMFVCVYIFLPVCVFSSSTIIPITLRHAGQCVGCGSPPSFTLGVIVKYAL